MTKLQFDPIQCKARLLGDTGYEWCLQDDFAEAEAVGGVASTANADLDVAIRCLLVGFDEPAERLLKKALDWVQAAIDADERPQCYAPFYLEASRYFTRAHCNWLLFGRDDTASFQLGIGYLDRYLAQPKISRDAGLVSLVLPSYPDAGVYDRALEVFAATPKFSPPTTRRIQGEAQMSYVVGRHRLRLEYSAAEFAAMSTKFLGRNIDGWLTDGLWGRAAEWMKIIHWNSADPPISAKEALLKCYDYLPGREPPTSTHA